MTNDILEGLNQEQKEAVLHFDSPLLIIAGAGSGKTRVITNKIAHMIQERGFEPSQILGVTFTNKAAGEMKERIQALTGVSAWEFNISTFHALGLRILRESGQPMGFDSEWHVMDDMDQKKSIERIVKENFDSFDRKAVDRLIKKINNSKMNLNYPNNRDYLIQSGFNSEEFKVFSLYHKFQLKNKVWDYEDLISLPVKLLENHKEVKEKYAERFKYVLVDEFQDTNPNQFQLVKSFVGDSRNITVVGDDDQAIYSWRGASVHFLFNFERVFPGTHVIKLEQNYRSTQQVLDFANNLIKCNKTRRGKSMWTRQKGNPVFVLPTISKEDEAEKTGQLINRLKDECPDLFPMAILYRINSQSLAFETEFIKQDIDFKILKGQPFFQRKEIKDSLALLKLALNIADDTSFLRVVDSLPLGIGDKTLDILRQIAREKEIPYFQALKRFVPEKFKAKSLFTGIERINGELESYTYSGILEKLIESSGYKEYLENRREESRLMNIQELIEFIRKFEEENPGESFNILTDRINLDSAAKEDDNEASVYLLTMHNAKGMEFPSVVVAGINSSYMPFFLRKEQEEIEEERRLFYVAATRAGKQLVVSTGSQRPSDFWKGIKKPLYTTVYSLDTLISHIAPSNHSGRPASISEFKPGRFSPEERQVEHPMFGRGKILKSLGNKKYIIHFIDKGEKVIDASIVKLEFL